MSDAERLLKLKEQIQTYKDERSRLEGRRDSLLSRLKEEFECSSVEEGKEKLAELEEKIESLDVEVRETVEKIEGKYAELSGKVDWL